MGASPLSLGARKINVIKAVRIHTGMRLKEAKDLVESRLPVNMLPDRIREYAQELTNAGAVVTIQ